MLEAILKMDKNSLSDDQLGFVMARRSYLNDADRARFADEIKAHEAGKLFSAPSEEVEEGADEEAEAPKKKRTTRSK